MDQQQTISKPVELSGRGLFLGRQTNVRFSPAPANHGLVFVRTDMGGRHVPALIQNVAKRPRRTAVQVGDAVIEVTEHVLSAAAGLHIDNLIIEIDGPELPAMDGSAMPFVEAMRKAGITGVDAPKQFLKITEPIVLKSGDGMLCAMPSETPGLEVIYHMDYSQAKAIGRQIHDFSLQNGNYSEEIASARTFCLESEVEALPKQGLGLHLSPEQVLVIGDHGPMGGNAFRFPDEPVRHKILDIIGDLYLVGAPIQGRIIAHKSGHTLNHMLARRLVKLRQHRTRREAALHKVEFDVRRLSRILPHRYPMMLVDRVLEVDGDRRAVGVKNVTMNEPFFQGHYPGTPIMPGVLIVEAMAQLSGVLIGQSLQHKGKLAVLLSLDRVKLRRPVTPGDQLILVAEAVRVRQRLAHMRCRAYVGEDLAAEAEVKFMLVDDEQV